MVGTTTGGSPLSLMREFVRIVKGYEWIMYLEDVVYCLVGSRFGLMDLS